MKTMLNRLTFTLAIIVLNVAMPVWCTAQVTGGNRTLVTPSKKASFSDYLIVKLKATTEEQKSYVRVVAKLTELKRLDKGLVLAMERYAGRKNPQFPLPVFERAMRFEAAKRGVPIPTIKEIVARNGASAAQAVRDSRIR